MTSIRGAYFSVPNGDEAGRAIGRYAASDRLPVDAQLVALAKVDRGQAFELLYNAYRGRIFTFLLRLSGTSAAADDLTQESFEKAYRALARLESDQKLLPWLYRIANNTAIDNLRRRTRFTWLPWLAVRGTSHESEPSDASEAASLRSDISDVLQLLPPDNAAALLLHALEGYSYAEIARIQGCTLAAARSRISRARQAFKDTYRPE